VLWRDITLDALRLDDALRTVRFQLLAILVVVTTVYEMKINFHILIIRSINFIINTKTLKGFFNQRLIEFQ